MFLKFKKKIFALKKLKKPPSKVAQKNSNPLFSPYCQHSPNGPTEEFMFQNVAYRPTVYRTGPIFIVGFTSNTSMYTYLN
jgi:hypothetical protein